MAIIIFRIAHTVNATACAIPRTVIAVCETFQSRNGTITIPSVLQPLMLGTVTIKPPSSPCRMTWMRQKSYPGNIK